MNRRSFLKNSSLAGAGLAMSPRLAGAAPQIGSLNLQTKHLIWIINGNVCTQEGVPRRRRGRAKPERFSE